MTDQGPILRRFPLPGEWADRAACATADPELFYPAGSGNGGRVHGARAICARCLVQAECLDYALACEDLDPYGGHGVWAGLTGPQRNRLRQLMKEPS